MLRKLLFQMILKTPRAIMIEPACMCNLKCPLCTTPHEYMNRNQGILNYQTYLKFLNEVKDFTLIFYFNFAGEPFLNPDLFKMVRSAVDENIFTLVDTNATLIEQLGINEILESQLHVLVVNIDYLDPDLFEQFRKGAKFNSTISQIKKLCNEKKKQNKIFPLILSEVIVTKDNEAELSAITKFALNEIGVDGVWYKTLCFPIHSDGFRKNNKISELVEKYLPRQSNYKRYNFVGGRLELTNAPARCGWDQKSLLLWDGRIAACCYDYDGLYTFGNVNNEHFLNIWKSNNYILFRKKKIRLKKLEICRFCSAE